MIGISVGRKHDLSPFLRGHAGILFVEGVLPVALSATVFPEQLSGSLPCLSLSEGDRCNIEVTLGRGERRNRLI